MAAEIPSMEVRIGKHRQLLGVRHRLHDEARREHGDVQQRQLRDESPYVGNWPISEVAGRLIEVSSQRYSGPDLLTLSFSQFDPQRTCDPCVGAVICCDVW